MSNNDSNPNIEWKKPGFDTDERVTRKVDVQKAVEHDVKDAKNVQKAYTPTPQSLPEGLNKIRKKIKEVYDDEDEDEDDYQVVAPPVMETESSLMNALNADEKKFLRQQENLQQNQLLEDTAKMAALDRVNKFAKETKIKKPPAERVLKKLQSTNSGDRDLAFQAMREVIKEETGLTIKGRLKDKDMPKLAKGIRKVKMLGADKHLQGMKVKDVIEIADKETEDKKIAEMILKKTGRKDKPKKIEKKVKELNLSKKERRYVEERLTQKKLEEKKKRIR